MVVFHGCLYLYQRLNDPKAMGFNIELVKKMGSFWGTSYFLVLLVAGWWFQPL